MTIVEKNNQVFEVDVETTKDYYAKHSKMMSLEMQNFLKQVPAVCPLLAESFEEFGVDLRYPDELCWCWKDDNEILHYNVAYTVTGKIVRAEQYETTLQDKSKLHIVLETEYVPNEQVMPYFAFTVYNIEMPWILEEAYPEKKASEKKKGESVFDKIVEKLKKYWTKEER